LRPAAQVQPSWSQDDDWDGHADFEKDDQDFW
jgi:hypothetical protein